MDSFFSGRWRYLNRIKWPKAAQSAERVLRNDARNVDTKFDRLSEPL